MNKIFFYKFYQFISYKFLQLQLHFYSYKFFTVTFLQLQIFFYKFYQFISYKFYQFRNKFNLKKIKVQETKPHLVTQAS